jgi:hypothetical protein
VFNHRVHAAQGALNLAARIAFSPAAINVPVWFHVVTKADGTGNVTQATLQVSSASDHHFGAYILSDPDLAMPAHDHANDVCFMTASVNAHQQPAVVFTLHADEEPVALQAQLDVLNGAEGYAGNFAFMLQGIDYTANDAWYSGIAYAPQRTGPRPLLLPPGTMCTLSKSCALVQT